MRSRQPAIDAAPPPIKIWGFPHKGRVAGPSVFPTRIPPRSSKGPEPPELEDAIQKADILIEALTWIRQFRGKITVIKLGGSVMEDPRSMTHLLLDIIFMETVGMRPVLVHGGGAAISRAMAEAGLEPRFRPGPPLYRRRHAGHRGTRPGLRNQRTAGP